MTMEPAMFSAAKMCWLTPMTGKDGHLACDVDASVKLLDLVKRNPEFPMGD